MAHIYDCHYIMAICLTNLTSTSNSTIFGDQVDHTLENEYVAKISSFCFAYTN